MSLHELESLATEKEFHRYFKLLSKSKEIGKACFQAVLKKIYNEHFSGEGKRIGDAAYEGEHELFEEWMELQQEIKDLKGAFDKLGSILESLRAGQE